jgi:FKBP-type peptidyl-prolyl cis-trans isomerase (trigger factor)
VRAQRQVKAVLLLDALAQQLNLSVPEEEVRQRIAEVATASGVERQQQVEAFYSKEENQHALERRLLHEKALHGVVDKAAVTVVEVHGDEEDDGGVAAEKEKD